MEQESTVDPDLLLQDIRHAFNLHYQGKPVDMNWLADRWESLDAHMVRRGSLPEHWYR